MDRENKKCRTCGVPIMRGSSVDWNNEAAVCAACLPVESRLESYLQFANGRTRVRAALAIAERKASRERAHDVGLYVLNAIKAGKRQEQCSMEVLENFSASVDDREELRKYVVDMYATFAPEPAK